MGTLLLKVDLTFYLGFLFLSIYKLVADWSCLVPMHAKFTFFFLTSFIILPHTDLLKPANWDWTTVVVWNHLQTLHEVWIPTMTTKYLIVEDILCIKKIYYLFIISVWFLYAILATN